KLAAILIDTARELVDRKILVVFFGIVTLTLLLFALALQTDVAGGAITSLKVFGMGGRSSPEGFRFGTEEPGTVGGLQAETMVRGVQLVVAFVLYPLGILLSLFATAGLVPRLLERGTIDLLLSKPMSRPALFVARYLGGLLVAALNLVYLVVGLGAILALKTGVWNGGFVLSALLMTLYFGCLLGFLVLVGVLSRSTTVSIMVVALVYVASVAVRPMHENRDWPLLITGHASRFVTQALVETTYHLLPRTYDFGRMLTVLILRDGDFTWGPILWSAVSGAGALALATAWFSRRDF
ncbi:MAG TPA: ABC transporter permease subunit, partial [Candidatus Polarisedimenticolia bacterium]|nr:ABC transporter permease subunit [Candidatus Polarisedimenticolia bacterium]